MLTLCATSAWHLPAGRPAVRAHMARHHLGLATMCAPAEVPPVRWLNAIDPTEPEMQPSSEEATVMPLFPLGVAYMPYSNHVLNIFEPRYRAMYNDILFNGARRFAVCNIDQETGRLAEVGVIFYLDELKEVSEQTDDRVKYVCTHSVTGRVKIKNVLNPQMATTRKSYLRAEVEELTDLGGGAGEEAEKAVEDIFLDLVNLQADLGEEPRFTEAVKSSLSMGLGNSTEDKGLWGTIMLWQQLLEQRSAVLGQKMQRDIQKGIISYLKDNDLSENLVNSRGEVRMDDLPPS